MQFIDQCNRTIALHAKPQRIISLVPSQTELLHDLDLEDQVVGITKFCVHPNKWYGSKFKIGGTKKFHVDKNKELDPDLIIANKEENTKKDIAALAEDFPVWVSDVNNLEDNHEMILSIGEMCGKQKEAKKIVSQIQEGFDNLQPMANAPSCLYFIWKDPYMVASSNTFISSILELCGFENLAVELGDRYPSATTAQISNLNPEIILLSSEPYPFKEKHRLQMQKSFPGAKAILVDGEMFSWYGSRLQYSAEYLQNLQTEIQSQLSA